MIEGVNVLEGPQAVTSLTSGSQHDEAHLNDRKVVTRCLKKRR